MYIVSVSRRTDIPAFHPEWFLNRLRAGFCHVPNPYNAQQPHVVSLRPADVLAFIFWTRNPQPLARKGVLDELDRLGIPYYFHVTITGYPKLLEQATLSRERAVDVFCELADRVGAQKMQWRYDPIVETTDLPWEWHLDNFTAIAKRLQGKTHRCYFSFVELYRKTRQRMDNLAHAHKFRYRFMTVNPIESEQVTEGRAFTVEEITQRANQMAQIAKEYGIATYTCCNDSLICEERNIYKAHCIDADIVREIIKKDRPTDVRCKIEPTRADCGCFESKDIGVYDTCPHGCVYCYAVQSHDKAVQMYKKRDDTAPSIVGTMATTKPRLKRKRHKHKHGHDHARHHGHSSTQK